MVIETDRMILRSFTENDVADAVEYLHEPMVHCFACMKTETMEDARKAVLDRAKDGEYYFAITLKDSGKVIGEIDAISEATAPDEENAAREYLQPLLDAESQIPRQGLRLRGGSRLLRLSLQ